MRTDEGPARPGEDRERIEALERTVRLLAETTRDALSHLREHGDYGGKGSSPDLETRCQIDRALGRLDAVLSTLGAGAPRRGGEGET